MIAMTVDTEWCPDSVIEDTISLLESYDVSATLFSTHNDSVATAEHERALHPNLFDEERNERAVIDDIAAHYPDASGIRTHGLYVHSPLRNVYPEFGLTYESNYIEYLRDGIKPFWLFDGVLQFPIYFMDDMWLRTRADEGHLPDPGTLLDGGGLQVYDFHPVHVFLNTPKIEYYQTHKEYYDDPEYLRERRAEGPGVRDLFVELLAEIERRDESTRTLGELDEAFRAENDLSDIRI